MNTHSTPVMASFKSCAGSSSSYVPTGRWTHDVFLSFRGEDTRNNIVDHLYAALVQKGIHAYKDDEMLHMGKPISPELLKAIEESRIAVVVFSKNYANSSWCLDELVKIMECPIKVLPVFYYVDPSDVRGQKQDYALAFKEHEEKFRGEMDKLNKWRKVLATAANLSGYHFSEVSGGESAIINKIVQDIMADIQPRGRENDLVGIESRMEELNTLLSIQTIEEVRIIGIFGMGGIGKTTIAQALFRKLAYKFEGSCFIKNVRENSASKKDICALQERILKDVLGVRYGFVIQDPGYGADMIQERCCNKNVLLVLDDVNDVKQLEFLAATSGHFGPGSRIIITTRDEHLLSDANEKYKPALLRNDQAVKLFSMHAFRKSSPPDGYTELSYRAIRYAGGLPLALKVLGSYFRGRKLGVWKSALDRLAKIPNNEIFSTLKLSYDDLNIYEQKIFLDIACFFNGKKVDSATRVLDSFGFHAVIGISVLIEKSLITVSNKILGMHDLIQEMGLQIVRESFPNSRLQDLEEIHYFIKRNKKLKEVEAIVLPFKNHDDDDQYGENLGLRADVFENMKNLRLLDVNGEFTSSEPTFFPDELRWLCWRGYPYSSIPLANLHKLGGLRLSGGIIEYLWAGQKILWNLKFIHLQKLQCLTRLPDVSGVPNVERLVLLHCENLVEGHESLGILKRLVSLEIKHCKNLKSLPSSLEMESLETLILYSCKSLERFPELSSCMVRLSCIHLYDCSMVEELPSSIRYLANLSFLSLIKCTSFTNIPNSICELKYLKSLYLQDCIKLQKLPEEFRRMKNLEKFALSYNKFFDRPSDFINVHVFDKFVFIEKIRSQLI